MPRIEIIAGGIYGATGEVPVGSVHEVSTVPEGWLAKVRVLADEAPMEIALTGITTEAILAGADIGAALDALNQEASPVAPPDAAILTGEQMEPHLGSLEVMLAGIKADEADDRDAIIAEIEAMGGKVDRRKSTDTLAAELAGLKG